MINQHHNQSPKRYIESLLEGNRKFRLEEEYIVGQFRADYVIFDAAGIPRIIFDVKQNNTQNVLDDIRSWKGECITKCQRQDIKMLLAYYDDGWHFSDENNKEVDLPTLLKQTGLIVPQRNSFCWFYLVGAMLSLVFLIYLLRPLLCNCSCHCALAPLTREMVTLLCAAGLCFILPSILPYIKEVHISGWGVVFTKEKIVKE